MQLQRLISAKKSQLVNDGVYRKILDQCTSMGYWNVDSATLLKDFLIENYQQKLDKYITTGLGAEAMPPSEDLTNFIYTTLAIQILAIHFTSLKAEWKMIMNKANKWARAFKMKNQEIKDAINQVEKEVKNMVQSFE